MTKLESLYQEWLSLQPLKEEDQRRLDQKFMLEFNYNSNHIEGNTLTYGQTEMLLLFGKVVDEASMKDLEDMKASNVGLKMVKESALDKGHVLTEYFIRTLHQTLLREDYTVYRELPNGTQTSYVVHAGQYKTRPNSVITPTGERFEYASPEETPALMADLLQWYHDAEATGEMSPIELAALFHYRYIRIHPFEDGNGRISRLLVNYILCRHGYPMIVVKTKDKKNYLNALNKCDVILGPVPSDGAHADISQIKPFVDYMSQCLERALAISIKAAKGESIEDADDWRKSLKLKYQTELNMPEITKETQNGILNGDFTDLLKKIDEELTEFYSLFTSVSWKPSNPSYFNGVNGAFYSVIDFSKRFDVISATFSITILIEFQQFRYHLAIHTLRNEIAPMSLYDKDFYYVERIADKDCEDIINVIGNQIKYFIETKGFTVTSES